MLASTSLTGCLSGRGLRKPLLESLTDIVAII